MAKRRTRRQWYEYHLAQSEAAAQHDVLAQYSPQVQTVQDELRARIENLQQVKQAEPIMSRIGQILGIETKYQTGEIAPLEAQVNRLTMTLSAVLDSRRVELKRAAQDGAQDYAAARALRQLEAGAREERVRQREQERRIRYLERSPAIRSASRFFRRSLISEHASEDEYVTCFYCGTSVLTSDIHLEHKRPVSRGGDNRRSNLVLACAACNLAKGRKTHDEFVRSRDEDAL